MKRYDRQNIFHRDRWRCVACHSRKYELIAHHVIPEADGGADNAQNIVTLCRPCHMQVTGFRIYRDVTGKEISDLCSRYLKHLFGDTWEPHSPLWCALMAYAKQGAESMAEERAGAWDGYFRAISELAEEMGDGETEDEETGDGPAPGR